MRERAKSWILSALLLALILFAWHFASLPKAGPAAGMDPEYAKLMGLDKPKSDGLPTLSQMGATAWKQISNPFYDAGTNDKGIGIQLAAGWLPATADLLGKARIPLELWGLVFGGALLAWGLAEVLARLVWRRYGRGGVATAGCSCAHFFSSSSVCHSNFI